jgi:hypothetical protein
MLQSVVHILPFFAVYFRETTATIEGLRLPVCFVGVDLTQLILSLSILVKPPRSKCNPLGLGDSETCWALQYSRSCRTFEKII